MVHLNIFPIPEMVELLEGVSEQGSSLEELDSKVVKQGVELRRRSGEVGRGRGAQVIEYEYILLNKKLVVLITLHKQAIRQINIVIDISTRQYNHFMQLSRLASQRETFNNQIRRNIKHDLLKKSRNHISEQSSKLQLQFNQTSYSLSQLQQLAKACYSTDSSAQLWGLVGIKKLLSKQPSPPIQAIIDRNLVPRLLDFVRNEQFAHMRLQAVWALTNIASGTSSQCQSIVQKGAISIFLKLLNDSDKQVVRQVIWALGNISGDCTQFRDMILRAGGHSMLSKLVLQSGIQDRNIITQGGWTISNLCRGNPPPKNINFQKETLSLCKVIQLQDLEDSLIIDLIWALSYTSQKKQNIKLIITSGALTVIFKQSNQSNVKRCIPALRTIGNLLVGTQEQTLALLDLGVVAHFLQLHQKYQDDHNYFSNLIKKEICWGFSNIAGNGATVCLQIVKNGVLANKMLDATFQSVIQIKNQAIWFFKNLFQVLKKQYPLQIIDYSHQLNLLQAFVSQLDVDQDASYLILVLHVISEMLNLDMEAQPKLKDLKGLQKLQKLQEHKSEQVYKQVIQILEKFCELQAQF